MINSAIALDLKKGTARAVKFFDVNKGDDIVVGHQGVRVVPVQRATTHTDLFQFINTTVDADEPKSGFARGAQMAARAERAGGVGPAAGRRVRAVLLHSGLPGRGRSPAEAGAGGTRRRSPDDVNAGIKAGQ